MISDARDISLISFPNDLHFSFYCALTLFSLHLLLFITWLKSFPYITVVKSKIKKNNDCDDGHDNEYGGNDHINESDAYTNSRTVRAPPDSAVTLMTREYLTAALKFTYEVWVCRSFVWVKLILAEATRTWARGREWSRVKVSEKHMFFQKGGRRGWRHSSPFH